ncbi:hypothetical protein [Parablautia sp. Marseille-Q6255]|uniref:hypothetical protein n=1 Tax=Parablautia sp. Marseille-Q6255 TaxID=3039593 RepID=UPI0024BC33AC|nr:hypothetical protein [Parablautia sp. Marseille-Q6255]
MSVKNFLYELYVKILFRTKYKKQEFFLCSRGIGDTVVFLSKLHDYKTWYPKNAIHLILQENHRIIAEGYKKYIDSEHYEKGNVIGIMDRLANQKMLPRNIHFILPPDGEQLLGYKDLSICDLVNISMGIPDTALTYEQPQFSWKPDRKEEIIKQYHLLEGKTVILAPYAVSVPLISKDLWNQLVEHYHKKGFQVLTNVKDNSEYPLDGTEGISLRLDEMYLATEYGGYFVGLRSGLCDLLAYSKCCMTVVYPANKSKDWRDKYTFSNMFFEKKIEEISEEDFALWIQSLK